MVASFRPFAQALDRFIVEQDYTGRIEDCQAEKLAYLTRQFQATGMPLLWGIKIGTTVTIVTLDRAVTVAEPSATQTEESAVETAS